MKRIPKKLIPRCDKCGEYAPVIDTTHNYVELTKNDTYEARIDKACGCGGKYVSPFDGLKRMRSWSALYFPTFVGIDHTTIFTVFRKWRIDRARMKTAQRINAKQVHPAQMTDGQLDELDKALKVGRKVNFKRGLFAWLR